MKNVETMPGIYSEDTGEHYDDIEALVAAETNGWCVVAMLDFRRVAIYGPYPNRRVANNARQNLKTKWRREGYVGVRTRITYLSRPEHV